MYIFGIARPMYHKEQVVGMMKHMSNKTCTNKVNILTLVQSKCVNYMNVNKTAMPT